MRDDVTKKRVFLICGHAQSGKTSLADAVLFKCQAVSRQGKVDDQTSISDYEEDEKQRKSSVNLSVMHGSYKGASLQFVDVPGYLDFIGELAATVRAVDFAVIVIDATEGVGVGTEKAWDYLAKNNIPCIFFVNKLDKEDTDYKKVIDDIKKSLTKKAVSVVCEEDGKIISVLKSKDKDGNLYANVVECVAESEDELLEKYLEQGTLEEKEVASALEKAILTRKIFPVVRGVATQARGVDMLLNFIVEEIPSSAEIDPKIGIDQNGEEVEIKPDVNDPLCAQVFKTIIDPFVGQLTIFRVFSGKISSNSEVYNATKTHKEKFGQLYLLQGKQQVAIETAFAGDIAAVAKLKDTSTQDTICEGKRKVTLPDIEYPAPSYSASLKPKTRQDEDKISAALTRLTSEDPTCRTSRDSQTKELIVSGMGELHLQIIVERLKRKYQANVDLGTPKVPYFETITKKIDVSHKYKKQSGGRGQYGDVSIVVEPLERGKNFEFVNNIVGGAIPRNFIPSVEKGAKKFMEEGVLAGYPITDMKVTLYDGSYHSVDSSDIAFQIATSMALKKAFEQAGSSLLEPVMDVEITVPEDLMGQITGDINGRRGRVLGMEAKGKNETVKAKIPLSEMFKYASDLRSITAGRGSYSMSFSHYDVVPQRIAQGIIDQAKKAKEEKDS